MSYKYTAIIIEPREHKALKFVLNNACDCLTNEWKIILFYGNNNIEYVTKIVDELNGIFDNKIMMVNLKIDNLNLLEYSKLLATKSIIYDYIYSEIFLVFQTDSMIFKQNSHLINNYLDYDYVGSPWQITNYLYTKNSDFIGNGGFSLRNKTKMLEIIEKINWYDIIDPLYQLEDLYFSRKYDTIDVKKPDYETAKIFSVGEMYSELAYGCHQPWLQTHYNVFKTIYPECEILRNLQ